MEIEELNDKENKDSVGMKFFGKFEQDDQGKIYRTRTYI